MPRLFAEVLAVHAPAPDALVLRLAAAIDDEMLGDMASLDYGRDIEEHRAALLVLRAGGASPVPMPWSPREVLELTRWFRPDDEPLPADRRRGHAMRAFACAVLLRASGEIGNHALCEGQNQTLVNLLWSLDALDAGHERAAIGLLSWLMGRLAPEQRPPDTFDWQYEDVAFLGVAMIWLGLRMRPRLPDAAIIAIAEWVADSEVTANRQRSDSYGLQPARWLLGATSHNLCHAEWRRLGRSLLEHDLFDLAPDAADWIRLIGTLLSE